MKIALRTPWATVRLAGSIGVAALVLSGCFGRNYCDIAPVRLPVSGAPQHIFADPIGYHFPSLAVHRGPLFDQSSARFAHPYYPTSDPVPAETPPLPDPASQPAPAVVPNKPADVSPPKGTTGDALTAPDLRSRQVTLRPARERTLGPHVRGALARVAASSLQPTTAVVPAIAPAASAETDARATIALRRNPAP